MKLPPFPEMTDSVLAAITERHGLGRRPITRLPDIGIFNAIYAVGDDVILRIPRDHPAHVAALSKEIVAVPAARLAGVCTPRIVAFDDSRELLPVPYSLYERVDGETLGQLHRDPAEAAGVWHAVGRDLALLHMGVAREGPVAGLPEIRTRDLRDRPEQLAGDGYLTPVEARWFSRWLERLAPAALEGSVSCFLHGDLQDANIMVERGTEGYLALLDWGGAGWGDPALDFAGIPLRAVPYLLEGHREVVPLPRDETAEIRILWRHLEFAIGNVRRGPQPDHSWAERPLPMLLDVLRFFLEDPPQPWHDLQP